MKKYIAMIVMIGMMSFGTAQASVLTQGQVSAIISILQAFGVDSMTVANVKNDLTINITIPNATTANIIPTVTYKTWVQANLQTLPAPTTTQSQPIQVSTPAPVIAPVAVVTTPAPIQATVAPVIPAITISQVSPTTAESIGASMLTAGNDPIQINTLIVTMSTVAPTYGSWVSINGGAATFDSLVRTADDQWTGSEEPFIIPAGGTLTMNILGDIYEKSVAQVIGYTATDLTTGATITQ